MSNTKSVRGWVAGRVQGVSYRASFAQQADRLNLHGWVKNLPDGRVEFLVHGSPASVQTMLDWAKRGPRFARVAQLHVADVDEPPPPDFEIR